MSRAAARSRPTRPTPATLESRSTASSGINTSRILVTSGFFRPVDGAFRVGEQEGHGLDPFLAGVPGDSGQFPEVVGVILTSG
jgi:hypothetical protein